MVEEKRRGRPRDEQVDGRILDAALELVLAEGYDRFSPDGVAAKAGVAKTTLYRRWPTKDHLILAVVTRMQNEVEVTDTGDLPRDLTRYLDEIAAGLNRMRKAGRPQLAGDQSAGLIAEIAAAAARHADIGAVVRQMFALRNKVPIGLLARARERGDLPEDVDPEVLFEQLAGALYYRVLITGSPIGPAYVQRLVTTALSATPAANRRKS
ncbi:TetR/AcrR family transcriptional regulator [Amycolatopsis viridis]|uniref:AcrR family transcriptional regulator n=1 Tax=Amycolatopsis viridis TaxID=185678 RepID=A0ABX0T0D9_9PSEU|nr:TetR/AcrR family transcriptional regulator [Amycolatopsis viridis]NIH82198.1 AcrR family transcriptional regulator [Amycolatopsis viridis]